MRKRSAIFKEASRQWTEMRADFDRYLQHEYSRAVEMTGGVLVNKEGRAEHIDGIDLFTGPIATANKYASEELKEYWEAYGRISLKGYEERWLAERLASEGR